MHYRMIPGSQHLHRGRRGEQGDRVRKNRTQVLSIPKGCPNQKTALPDKQHPAIVGLNKDTIGQA